MAAATLEFLPFEARRALVLGDATRRVTLASRSPSPAGLPTPPATQATPRRIAPVTTAASSSKPEPASPAAPATPTSLPSRKGKERELGANGAPKPNGTPKTTGSTPNGTPNGHAHAHGNGPKANGSARPAPKAAAASSAGAGLHPPIDDLAWPEPIASAKRPAAGLHNGSMACYTNATLQVLLHTPPVLRVALAHDAASCVQAKHTKTKFCMLCALRQVAVAEHWAGKKRAYRPVPVHNHLGQIKKGFSRHRQEDTHEFFRFVTDALQNTALAGKPKDLPEKLKRTTWVYRTWGGQVRSRVLCLTCRKPSDTFDSFLDLSLDVPARARTLDQLFKGFIHEDRLDGENKYNCENCKKKSAATKSMRIAEAPPVLTLHLKRFGFSLSMSGRMTKMNNAIEYGKALDIAPYMTEGRHEGTRYRLFGVTCHHGTSLNYGHYTSYVHGPDGRWYSADDDDVSHAKLSDVLNDRSAYLLSYIRDDAAEMSTPVSTPAPAVAGSVGPKRRRDDESAEPASPSPVKRPAPAALSPIKRVANGESSAFERLLNRANANGAPSSPKSPVRAAPKPQRPSLPPSPISRPSHPSPGAKPAKFKSKHHRVDAKQLAVGSGSRHHHKGAGAPKSPFVAGAHGRSNLKQREAQFGRKQKRMKGKRG
ncbi:hypothetical protein Q8F55_006546 [Vanrija albida]|uniref:ubiquitinyl hydrolase 1 n=1 Tax=Vanrija albida TaxID=181172 RepID=A0ABR3PXR1_9TREE